MKIVYCIQYAECKTNIRQRGDVGGSAKKVGLRIKELERIYGIQHGATSFQGNQHSEVTPKLSDSSISSQEQLADMIGISVDTLSNYKKLTELANTVDVRMTLQRIERRWLLMLN